MRTILFILTLVILLLPKFATASDAEKRRTPQHIRSLSLHELMVPSPFQPSEFHDELAAPPPDYGQKEEPRPLFIRDVEFLKRSETRHVYGQ